MTENDVKIDTPASEQAGRQKLSENNGVDRAPTQKKRVSGLVLIPLIALIMMVLFGWGLLNKSDELPSALLKKPVPEFSLPPVQGRSTGLATSDLMGKVSLVNVFASWCVPCRIEHPMFMELAQQGIVPIYGINYKDKPAQAEAWLAELGDPYTLTGADLDGRVGIEWGVYGVPETYVIGADGRIAYRHVGPLSRAALSETVLPIIRDLQSQSALTGAQ